MPNKFFVGLLGDNINVMKTPEFPMTKEDALNLAAWIVALADESDDFRYFREKANAALNS